MNDESLRHTGKRVKALRLQRGLSLRTLAELAGISIGMLSMLENGHRKLERSGHILALAAALRVAPAELVGQPFPPTAQAATAAHLAIPSLRLALLGIHVANPGERVPLPARVLAARVAEANRLYHACAYDSLTPMLAGLLGDLHAAVESAESADRPDLLRLLARAYHPACALLLKNLGYTDLAFVAVTRAADAIEQLDDPVYRALSGFFHTHILMAAGSPDQALARATRAADELERHLVGTDGYALLGELHLIRATCLTQDSKRSGRDQTREIQDHLVEAADLAGRTGETNAWHLNFGPTNVGIHQVSLNTDLGRHEHAVSAAARVTQTLTAPGRRAAYHGDLGRSLSHLRGRGADAVAAFLTAERIAPQRVHSNVLVREAVAGLTGRQLPAGTARDLRGLAHRMGLAL
jgi:transcriptional regulator with XRE-family HTH domain